MQTDRNTVIPDELEEGTGALFAARLRAILWIVVGGITALSIRDWLGVPTLNAAIFETRAVCAAACLGLLAATHSRRLVGHMMWLVLLAGLVVCIDVAAVSTLRNDAETTPILLSAVIMIGATVFPRGLKPQFILVAIAEIAVLANIVALTGGLTDAINYHHTAGVFAFVASLYVAKELDRQRQEIKRGAQALSRSEAHFRSLIETSSDLITVIRPDGTILYDSPAHERLLGYSRAERIGQNALALIHPDDVAGVLETIASGIQVSGQMATLEYRYRHKDGTWRHIEAIGRNLLDDPNVGAIVVNSRDITERKQMEAELRRSQTYLKTLFDHAPVAFYLNDLQGRLVDGNRAAEELIGYKTEELVGDNILTLPLLASDELPTAIQLLRHSTLGPIGPIPLSLRHKDGHMVTAEVRAIPITVNEQTLILGIATDITERKRIEEERKIDEQRHQQQRDALIKLTSSEQLAGNDLAAGLGQITETAARTLGVSRTSIWRYNRDRTAIRCVELYELEADRHSAGGELSIDDYPAYFQSLTEMDVMAADDAQHDRRTREFATNYLQPLGISSMMDACIHIGGGVDGVLCHEHTGPPRRWTEDEKTFAAAVVNLVSLAVEGWERKQVEHAQSLLTAILDATPDLVAMADASDTHILYMNPAGRRMIGVDAADDVTRLTIADAHPPWVNRQLQDEILPAAVRDGVWTGESAFLNRDGHEVPVLMVLLAHKSPSGRIERFSTVSRDITERKSFEAQLLDAKQAAEAANRAKSEFLANMSHEIRTPMNGIIGMTELALQTDLNAEQRDCLQMVATSGEALLAVINDVLDFSKIEAGKLDMDPVDVDVRETLAAAVAPLVLRAHLKGLALSYEVHPEVPDKVVLDPHRLRQVLTNLIGNAVKFTDQGGIVVSAMAEHTAAAHESLHFSIHDTGVGIAADKQQVIFQAFQQADTSTTRKYGGSGLGLTISRKLVEMMGGRIWVESEVNRGSTFHFTVRCQRAVTGPRPEAAVAAEPSRSNAHPGESHPRRVLLAEDNLVNQKLATRLLGKHGHTTVVANNGREALAALAKEKFDVVFMDVQMPEMDGFEATAAIRAGERATGAHIPIIAMTAHAMSGDEQRCLAAGMDDYLPKPIDPKRLFALLDRLPYPSDTEPTPA